MARVTVEDCVLIVPNRFELVVLSSQRAKDIASGGMLTVDRDNDKNAVVSLREIAGKTVDVDVLRECVMQNLQRKVKTDRYEPEPTAAALEEGEASALEVMQEIESYNIPAEDFSDQDGMSFSEENLDVDD